MTSLTPPYAHYGGQDEGGRGATSFLVAAGKKSRGELAAILSDPAKLRKAAAYHGIKPEWARFWIGEELNRNDRRN